MVEGRLPITGIVSGKQRLTAHNLLTPLLTTEESFLPQSASKPQ